MGVEVQKWKFWTSVSAIEHPPLGGDAVFVSAVLAAGFLCVLTLDAMHTGHDFGYFRRRLLDAVDVERSCAFDENAS